MGAPKERANNVHKTAEQIIAELHHRLQQILQDCKDKMLANAVAAKARLEEKIDRGYRNLQVKQDQEIAKIKDEMLKNMDSLYKKHEEKFKDAPKQYIDEIRTSYESNRADVEDIISPTLIKPKVVIRSDFTIEIVSD